MAACFCVANFAKDETHCCGGGNRYGVRSSIGARKETLWNTPKSRKLFVVHILNLLQLTGTSGWGPTQKSNL